VCADCGNRLLFDPALQIIDGVVVGNHLLR
jgi:hypothetical protein